MLQVTGIDPEWLIRPTGDPFADAGGYGLEQFWEKHPDKDIIGLIREAANIYVKYWDNNLHSFFLNSTITHNSNKGQKGIDKTLRYFQNLIDGKEPHQEGYCRITGQKTKLFFAGRDNHIMSGSGTLINFHHAFQTGILLSREVLIRIFFVPLGLVQLGNKVALIHSNDEEVTRFFVKQNLSENFREIGSGMSKSILKSEFNNPANALFNFAEKCIANLKVATSDRADSSRNRGITLNLYHFSNFGASPEIKLHTLPAVVFNFYARCLRSDHKKSWKRFVNNYYRSSKFKDAHFNDEAGTWENKKEVVSYDEFKIWRNVIFEKLLSGESLLREFLFWSKKNTFPFHIVEQYQQALRNMDKRTLQKIKGLADYIMQQDEDYIKKSITRLNGMKSSYSIRQFLLSLIAKNHKDGNEILITLEEYVEYLFPDGASWREIRDLLLIAIYQKLHETNTTLDLELPEPDLEAESETIN